MQLLEAYTGTGVIFGLLLPPDATARIQPWQRDRTDDLHLTLNFIGTTETLSGADLLRTHAILQDAVREWTQPMTAMVQGLCRFINASPDQPRSDAVVLTLTSPAISAFQQLLAAKLSANGLLPAPKHSFVPHITLGYFAPQEATPLGRFEPFAVRFAQVALFIAGVQLPLYFRAP
jgi:2'-5' RNA ligase